MCLLLPGAGAMIQNAVLWHASHLDRDRKRLFVGGVLGTVATRADFGSVGYEDNAVTRASLD